MRRIWVHLPDRSRTLWDLVSDIGVTQRIEYVNNIGRANGSCDDGGWLIEEKRHDLGLKLNDRTVIKGIDPKHFNFFKEVPIIKIFERQ